MIELFKHLLPKSKALSIIVDKTLRRFFNGLTGIPDDYKDHIDQIWLDIIPEDTRELTAWESQFGIISPAFAEADRRDSVLAAWQRGGGLGPDTLQDVLQTAGFDLYVHDPWYFGPGKLIRNPNTYLLDGDTTLVYTAECGEPVAECGEPTAACGDTSTPTGTLLVNKIFERSVAYVSAVTCGESDAACGEPAAECGNNTGFLFLPIKYIIPSDSNLWPYFWYIGGEVFGDSVSIPLNRKDELETLILKIGPAHLWAGLFVNYGS